ncbi:MAG: flavodoxin family protein [Dehalococcoidales bacterium]|nr:flavodoxin family protein [Dehalococcoidales bacterium]
MKVLGIIGSPRHGGNTEILVNEVLASVREEGAATDVFHVADKNISGCDGCGGCFPSGVCRIKDDMQELYRKMEWADAIVFGSPVYFNYVTAQAKAIIDRTFCYLASRRLQGKVAAPVLALRRIGGGQTRVQLFGWFISQGMIPVRGAIGYGAQKGEVRTGVGGGINVTALEEARQTGKDIIAMLKRLSK